MCDGPSLQRRVSTFLLLKRRVTPVPSLCHLKVVAARVIAQLFSLTLHWICRCSVRKTGLVCSDCVSLFVPSFLLCGLALPLLVLALWLVRPVSFPSFFLVSLLVFPVAAIVRGHCGFHDRCVRQIARMTKSEHFLP